MALICSLDVEMFINEVKKYPELWDINNEHYRHKKKKQRAWDDIAGLFIKDYQSMFEIDKLEVYRRLYGKWRNIRDSYVRNLRKKDGKKSYMYAKHLSFLGDVYEGGSNHSDSDGEAENNDDSSQACTSDADDKPKRGTRKRRRSKRTLDDSNTLWQSDTEEPPSTIENLKRKRIINVQKNENPLDLELVNTFQDTACSYSLVEDEDKSFFESLLPAVRQFNLDQKLEFRSEVIALIKNIRSQRLSRSKMKREPDDLSGESDD